MNAAGCKTAGERGKCRLFVGQLRSFSLALMLGVGLSPAGVGALGCSSPVDVVAVVGEDTLETVPPPNSPLDTPPAADEPLEANPSSSNGAGDPSGSESEVSAAGSESGERFVVVVGREMPKWQGFALDWPLRTPLSTFFFDPDSKSTHAEDKSAGDKSAAKHDDANDNPEVLKVMDFGGEPAQRLMALFAQVPRVPGEPVSIVVRDMFNDQYLVVLRDDDCKMSPASSNLECASAEVFD
jgi:hypothetical protein